MPTAPKRAKPFRKFRREGASGYLEDVTNSKLRRMGRAKQTKALFDSPEETRTKTHWKARFRVDSSILDESLHVELGVLEKIIKEGRKEREETRQQHLRRAAKEKEMRARQGQVIREINRPDVENLERSPSVVSPAVSTGSASASAAEVSPSDTAPSDAASSDGKIGEETVLTEEAGADENPSDSEVLKEILSPRQLMARVRLVQPPSAKAPKILNREELVKAIVDHKKNTQDRGRLSQLLAQLEPELPRLAPSHCASLLLALPRPAPPWSAQLLHRLARQADALNTHTLVTVLLGIARVQKLAVLQSFDDKQMIATCEAALAALLPFAKAVLRLAQELQAMEAASLAIGCAKATLRCSRTMRSLSTALLPHLQAADSPLLGRDVLACLAAFGAAWPPVLS